MHTPRTVLLTLALCLLAAPCAGQSADTRYPIVDVGFGLGPATHGLGVLLHLGVGTPIGDLILRGAGSTDLVLFFEVPESSGDLAILYGRSLRGRRGWVRGAAGIGIADTTRRGGGCAFILCDYELITRRSAGLALQLDVVWAFSSPVGLGLTAFGNVNGAASFGGAVVSLHVGRLR